MHVESARSTTASVDRGQSSVIGVVLVVGLTLLGVTGLMLFGTTALSDAHTRAEIDAAEHAMTQLDSQFSLVALGSAERQGASINLQSGASMTVDGDQGWMNVSVVDRDEGDFEIFNTTLGAVTYENEGTTVAYEGGGVWRKSPSGGSVMVSPPEFHYRTRGGDDPTLTLPLVVVRGSGSTTGEATVTKEETIARFPDDTNPDRANPLRGGEINVTVHSEYYQAWGAFFEDRTGGSVTYDHDREVAMISLLVEHSAHGVDGGIVTSPSGKLVIENNAEARSYNSSDLPLSYDGENTSIVVAGNVDVLNNAVVHGNLKAGGGVYIHNNGEVTGNVTHGGTLDNDGTIGGRSESGAEVGVPSAIDWLIDDRIEDLSDSNNNNNGDTGVPIDSSNRLQNCDPECKLEDGQYYLTEIDNDGDDTLVLDTSDGDVHIAVDGDVHLGKSEVDVVGDGSAKFYIEGEAEVGNGGTVSVGDKRSPGLWFYMNPDESIEISNNAEFVGVIYGPPSGEYSGVDVTISQNAKVYGGIVGNVAEINQNFDVYFDEALIGIDPIEGYANGKPTVTYLHVTENRVYVSSR